MMHPSPVRLRVLCRACIHLGLAAGCLTHRRRGPRGQASAQQAACVFGRLQPPGFSAVSVLAPSSTHSLSLVQIAVKGALAIIVAQPTAGLAAMTDAVATSFAKVLNGYEQQGAIVMIEFGHEMNGESSVVLRGIKWHWLGLDCIAFAGLL